jgi:signal transduction histidine kinase/CheY-like chemotaxis protein/AraC-like DNA-binding protein
MTRFQLLLFSSLLIIWCVETSGQVEQSDSLLSELKSLNPSDVKNRVEMNSALAWSYRDARPDSALFYANKARILAQEHGFDDLEIQAINYVGVAYRNLSNFSKAFEKYLEALKLSEERGNMEQRGYSLINLGNLYLYQTNYQGAIKYFIQALDQAQALANKRMVGYCFLNLGRSYKGIAEYGQAELYFSQAIDIRKNLEDTYGEYAAKIDLAEVYLLQGDLNKAEKYHLSLIDSLKPLDNPRLQVVVFNNLSKLYLAKNQLSKAEAFAFKALRITKDVNTRYDEKNTLDNLSKIYAQAEDFERAYQSQVKYSELNQQLFSEENIRRIEQLKGQYEMEQQELENQYLRKQTELNRQVIRSQRIMITLSVVGVILFLVTSIVSVRAYLVKKRLSQEISQQRDKIATDKQLIEKQSDKLLELDKAKSRFFANVSHDLRSPLSLIIGNLDMLKDDQDVILTASAIRNIETAHKNCKRLLYLTDEINDLTKLEEGKISLKKEVVKLSSYINMLTEMFVGTAQYKGVKLTSENAIAKDEAILIDPRQFEKIYYNLVSNAIRHTSAGDKIAINTSVDGDQLMIEVRDSGEGIAPESLPYVFDRFYQSRDNEYRSREGLGIGLALVKELVELHGGKITVESTLGLGTSFKIWLPRAVPNNEINSPLTFTYVSERKHLYDDLDKSERVGANLPNQDEEKPSILMVDDHPEIRYHIRQILEDDYHLIEAAHGIEALELLKTNDVEVIISDLMMPWMDGFEFIESLKKDDQLKKIPVLVVSARITDSDQERVLTKGVNDYLQKPFQKKELVLRINNLLKQKEVYQGEEDVFAQIASQQDLEDIEKNVLKKLEQVVMEKIGDENLSVFDLGEALAASERQVYRLVKKITGLTPYEYVTEVRMKYADYLIRKSKVRNATELAKKVGFKNVTAFSRQYEKVFGTKPTDLLSTEA